MTALVGMGFLVFMATSSFYWRTAAYRLAGLFKECGFFDAYDYFISLQCSCTPTYGILTGTIEIIFNILDGVKKVSGACDTLDGRHITVPVWSGSPSDSVW